jgi:hypothetical protein
MWKKVLDKNRCFKQLPGSLVLVESGTGRKFYPVVSLLQSGALRLSDCYNLQKAGEEYLPAPSEMKLPEILKLKELLKL